MTSLSHLVKAQDRKRPAATLLWSAEKDDRIRAEYPSYPRLQAQLPHRTLSALKHRARSLGIVRCRHVWTTVEVRRLIAACERNASRSELLVLFPGLRVSQIVSKARHVSAARRRARLVAFDVPALDTIRSRAASRHLSLTQLDRQARTGRFFQKSSRRPVLKHLARAAALLAGEVRIEWID